MFRVTRGLRGIPHPDLARHWSVKIQHESLPWVSSSFLNSLTRRMISITMWL